MSLNLVETGAKGGRPLVLLHGFAAHAGYWEPVIKQMAGSRHVLAYDLPGHGASAVAGDGGTRDMARAVAADLAGRVPGPVDLAGHSMGGAVACLIALSQPAMVHSLSLLAPGGFGREINAKLLKRFAAATTREQLEPLFEQFYGWRSPVPEGAVEQMVALRQKPGMADYLVSLADRLFDDDVQREIDRHAVAALGIPTKVIWGTQDRVTPTRQAHKLPGMIGVHVFEGVGHSVADEIPAEVVRLIGENCR